MTITDFYTQTQLELPRQFTVVQHKLSKTLLRKLLAGAPEVIVGHRYVSFNYPTTPTALVYLIPSGELFRHVDGMPEFAWVKGSIKPFRNGFLFIAGDEDGDA